MEYCPLNPGEREDLSKYGVRIDQGNIDAIEVSIQEPLIEYAAPLMGMVENSAMLYTARQHGKIVRQDKAVNKIIDAMEDLCDAFEAFGDIANESIGALCGAAKTLKAPTGKPPKRWIAPGAREVKNGLC